MTYKLKFTYRVISDSFIIYVDHNDFTQAENAIQLANDELTLEIVQVHNRTMFSGVQILNASFIPIWTEYLDPFLTKQLMAEFISVFSRLSWKSNETEPENIFERIIGERWTMLAEPKDLEMTLPI